MSILKPKDAFQFFGNGVNADSVDKNVEKRLVRTVRLGSEKAVYRAGKISLDEFKKWLKKE